MRLKEKQEILFNKNCQIEFLKIQNKVQKYIPRSGNQQSREQFLNNLVKKEPSIEDDFDQCFDIISKDLIQKNAFDFVFTDKITKQEINQQPLQETQKEKYSKIFKDILHQIKNFKNNESISSYCNLSNLYMELEYISKIDLDIFLNTKDNKDLSKFCESKDKKQAILLFLKSFQIFGYGMNTENLDEVEDLVLFKKRKTILDYLTFQDNSYYENYLHVSHELKFLDGLNLRLQKKVIELNEYQEYMKEFKKNQIFIKHKKLLFNEKVSISKFSNYSNNEIDYGFFDEIMSFKSDWKHIYSLIYDTVIKEYRYNQTLDATTIQTIMDELEIKIDQLNQCFFKYGAILGDIGQGLLYNFAIFVIWRIQCYQKHLQYKKQEQNLILLKQEIFERFLADIKQDQSQQSFLNGKVIAKEIIKQSIRQNSVNFAKDARETLNQFVNDPKMQSFDLIAELDTKLFNKNEKQYSLDKTLQYIDNPVDFIVKEVNERTNKIREQITTQYNQKLQDNQMKDLNHLLQKLQNISQQVKKILKPFSFSPNQIIQMMHQGFYKAILFIFSCFSSKYFNGFVIEKIKFQEKQYVKLQKFKLERIETLIKQKKSTQIGFFLTILMKKSKRNFYQFGKIQAKICAIIDLVGKGRNIIIWMIKVHFRQPNNQVSIMSFYQMTLVLCKEIDLIKLKMDQSHFYHQQKIIRISKLQSLSSMIMQDVLQTFNLSICKLQKMQWYQLQSAFQLAYEKIVAVKNFDQFNKHVIFFYTDGGDSYPASALAQFARLPQQQRMKIDLIACCLDKQQKTMIDITDFFNKNCSVGRLQDQMEPSQIGEAWRNQIQFIIV
ncbi:unnamed protein product [Paramecium octaurelia]|uniref:Uncharacterized protein n=1 Tax=Paramecium octaurelia TaxID=43137 RepID=A0A8S1VP34_PAROT|nr:unnamed protein product [Paramecium octaurelia]